MAEPSWKEALEKALEVNTNCKGGAMLFRDLVAKAAQRAPEAATRQIHHSTSLFKSNACGPAKQVIFKVLHPDLPLPSKWLRSARMPPLPAVPRPRESTAADALGVGAAASRQEILAAWRAASLRQHPDKSTDPRAVSIQQQLNAAKEELLRKLGPEPGQHVAAEGRAEACEGATKRARVEVLQQLGQPVAAAAVVQELLDEVTQEAVHASQEEWTYEGGVPANQEAFLEACYAWFL
jgi:hypothetical protein